MSHTFQLLDVLLILPMYLCVYEILILFLFYSPVIVKINIIEHLVFVGTSIAATFPEKDLK